MKTPTKIMKIHEVAYKNLLNKKVNIEKTIEDITHKPNNKIYMTELINFISAKPIYIDNDEIKKYFINKHRRKTRWLI